MRDIIVLIIIVLIGFASILIPLVSLDYFLQKEKCYAKYSEYQPEFSFWGGCRVVWEGRITPVENIGFRDIN